MCNNSAFAIIVLDAVGRCPGSALVQMVGLVRNGDSDNLFTVRFDGISLLEKYRMRFEADFIEKRIQIGESLNKAQPKIIDLEDAFDQMADWFENTAKDIPIWTQDAASAHTIINGMALVAGNKSPIVSPLLDVSTLEFLTEISLPVQPVSLHNDAMISHAQNLADYVRLVRKCIPSYPGMDIAEAFSSRSPVLTNMRLPGSICG